ncbi:MAG TPA: AAA family ATPase [Isosphaeraceae bacterium]|nr:AAA family ATPase [Isosphaeraceae bacterium]
MSESTTIEPEAAPSIPVEVLAGYVPDLVLRRLASRPTAEPEAEVIEAAVMLADVCGFTSLSERLAAPGQGGAEALMGALNNYFGPLIETIAAHGGDVVKMAGDALVAVWSTEALGEPLTRAALRAVRCAREVQATLRDYRVAEGIRLSSKAGIGVGTLLVMGVGGGRMRRELLIDGASLVDVGNAEKQATAGDVVLGPGAWSLVRDAADGQPLKDGCVRLVDLRDVPPPRRLDAADPGPGAGAALTPYIPGAIRDRLAAGQGAWLAELRPLTVLFVKLGHLDERDPRTPGLAQAAFHEAQEALYRHEGSLNKLSVDEKGVTIVAAMGLPPLGGPNDAVLALAAAEDIRARLATLGLRCPIGVATGRVYCGEAGNARRREYTIIGRVVNLAARLMQAGEDTDAIHCDEATRRAAARAFRFEALPPRAMKNIGGKVPLFRPIGRAERGDDHRPIVGRELERAVLAARLDALREGQGGAIVLEGEPGIGKSRLVAAFLEDADARDVTRLVAAADAIERTTPYLAWRPLFERLFEVDGLDDPDARRARVLEGLDAAGAPADLAPLLDAVLPIDLPESDRTAFMAGQARADSTNDLLAGMLRAAARRGPLAIVVEDLHWLDSASEALLRKVSAEVAPALIVATTRPTGDGPAIPGAERVVLAEMTEADTRALACQRLGVATLPPEVVDLVHRRSQGNPFFTEELTMALLDSRRIVVDEAARACRVAEGVDLKAVELPDRVQGVISGRIGRLPPAQQLTLKVASVIGRLFELRLLVDIYPQATARPEVRGHVERLRALNLVRREDPEPDLSYLFRHVITRDVVYEMLPEGQRRPFHRQVAEWYERTQAADLDPYLALLAYHWSQAGEEGRAIGYLEQAGDLALRGGAYQEAAAALEEALRLADRARPAIEPGRRARWEYQLGEAYLSLGRLGHGREHAERALALLGRPAPKGAGLAAGFAWQVPLQVFRRLRPARGLNPADPSRPGLLLASSTYTLIGQLCYYDQKMAEGVFAALRSLNLAEGAGASAELARSYAVMCIAAGLVPLRAAAAVYGRRALEVADRLDDPPTRAWVLQLTGINDLGIGRWDDARRRLGEAVAIHHRLGDWRRWEESSGELARLEYYLGEFERASARFAEFGAEARRRGHVQAIAWSLHGRAKISLRLGRLDEALAFLDESKALPADAVGAGDEILREGLRALIHHHRGDLDAARAAADAAACIIRRSPPMVGYSLEGYSAVAEVYLALIEAGAADPSLPARARRARRALRGIARVFPTGLPRARLCDGLSHRLAGRPRRAQSSWRRGLDLAESLAMPFEQALLHAAIGRHLDPHDPSRRRHLDQARARFERLGARWDLGKVPSAE